MRKVAIAVPLVLGAIQLVPVPRENPIVVREVDAPRDVHAVLQRACYDCHSHETVWPWYAHVAPVSWLVAYDVRQGRKHLNFSDWDRFADEREEIWEEVSEGHMPPAYYSFIREQRRLKHHDRELLRLWSTHGTGHGAALATEGDEDERHDEGDEDERHDERP